MAAFFTPDSLKFLRGLARHNDRAWFDPRKPIYEREIKQPMLALIGEINHALSDFAPAHVRDPRKVMMRIYRDTRFDAARGTPPRPYKTNVAAWWVRHGLAKTSGAGFYFHFTATETVIAAGAYMLTPPQLLAVRRHIEVNHRELRTLLAAPKLRAAMDEMESPTRRRVPRGFAADSPAADLLLHTRWGVSATLPAEAALKPDLLRQIVRRFRLAAPLVAFLNAGIGGERSDEMA